MEEAHLHLDGAGGTGDPCIDSMLVVCAEGLRVDPGPGHMNVQHHAAVLVERIAVDGHDHCRIPQADALVGLAHGLKRLLVTQAV
ncbi:MAG TPA: hypothetical protein VGM99_06565, partial [Candidatus Cybelea sp.]